MHCSMIFSVLFFFGDTRVKYSTTVIYGVYYEKLAHMLKPLVRKFHPDLSDRFKDIAEKQGHAKLKPIVKLHKMPMEKSNE